MDKQTDYTRPTMRELSTAHVTKEDLPLLLDRDAPQLFAVHRSEFGSFFVTQTEDLEETLGELKEFGFSDAFINLFTSCYNEGCQYLYLDADAQEDENLPIFTHKD